MFKNRDNHSKNETVGLIQIFQMCVERALESENCLNIQTFEF